jgi:hypothetical protein
LGAIPHFSKRRGAVPCDTFQFLELNSQSNEGGFVKKLLMRVIPVRQVLLLAAVLLCVAAPSFAQSQQLLPWVGTQYGDYIYFYNPTGDTQDVEIRFVGNQVDYIQVAPYDELYYYGTPSAGYARIFSDYIVAWAMNQQVQVYPVGYTQSFAFDGTYNNDGLAIANPYSSSLLFEVDIISSNWTQVLGAAGYEMIPWGAAGFMVPEWVPGVTLPANFHVWVHAQNTHYFGALAADCTYGVPCSVISGS